MTDADEKERLHECSDYVAHSCPACLCDAEARVRVLEAKLQAAEARVKEMEDALKLCVRELEYMLRANPNRDGGLYRKACDSAKLAISGRATETEGDE